MCTNDIYVHIYTPRYSPLTAPLRTTNCASLAILDSVKAPSYQSRRGLDTDRIKKPRSQPEVLYASGSHAV